ncbi:antibiotic biosynthesis monooxygenase [Rhodococcus spelaei]|uniref:Antibiotic biosynthesis monooxygenase n=1 Tax=Rhodococcus spelaei TaxID=2546320 RepID=A0A541BMV6_9NOCA|nr:antibiotic biosynthesis monooxygenase family protein [Rhodococcus spelaei]TQF73651.1 antibiotic biosynthesis monooxygenase [Rhodococcus spelaei]
MIIVAGPLYVDPARRTAYLDGCTEVVGLARQADGCRDFAVSPDLVDPSRINVFECWESEEQLQRFRGSGPDAGQQESIVSADVREYPVNG